MSFVPRPLFIPVVLAAVALSFACGGDDDSNGNGNGSEATATPVAPFTSEDLLRLAETEVEGFTRGEPFEGAGNVTVTYETRADEDSPILTVLVTLTNCNPFVCWDLEAPVSADQEANLKSLLPSVHIQNPDLVWEVTTPEIAAGYTAFANYSRSFVQEGGSTATVNGYLVFYHDGVNHITLNVYPRFGFDGPQTAAELEASMTREEAHQLVREVFTPFRDHFAPNDRP